MLIYENILVGFIDLKINIHKSDTFFVPSGLTLLFWREKTTILLVLTSTTTNKT
ncbi:hypothetical protein BC781_107182 [Sediminitomix flava]|uniref:Uncharacterized protein n=1 Tax=Sediminitomix flava TaxID=379075 RepID=A0A315Z596_SEDFL|nr:hypothetical protein BC781_107182 [Sediminitomix flava]